VEIIQQPERGNHLRAEISLAATPPKDQIMLLGHLDTVYPIGTISSMPFRIADGRAHGPGTFDMKGGLVMALAAIDALKDSGAPVPNRVVALWNSDEEIGSASSHALIEQEARKSKAVLVLEPSLGPTGRLKTARKGVGTAEIVITGRSAHAGIDPEKGINAVHELALQIEKLMKLNNPRRGVTVQTTVVAGGTTCNVIPEHARAQIDIRFSTMRDAKILEQKFRALRPILRGAKVELLRLETRPPLERTPAVVALFRSAQKLMRQMGLQLAEGSTGGGSDGNFTAALGIPTLDGLGAVGDGAHSPREYALIRALPERAALLAGLLGTL
jgi:glutamate carboxypeptidase